MAARSGSSSARRDGCGSDSGRGATGSSVITANGSPPAVTVGSRLGSAARFLSEVGATVAAMSGSFTITPRGAFSLRESVEFGFGQRHSDRFAGFMRLAFVVDGTDQQVGVVVRQDADGVHGEVRRLGRPGRRAEAGRTGAVARRRRHRLRRARPGRSGPGPSAGARARACARRCSTRRTRPRSGRCSARAARPRRWRSSGTGSRVRTGRSSTWPAASSRRCPPRTRSWPCRSSPASRPRN